MLDSKDLNYYGKSIGTIIIFLIFIIGLIIIIDEFLQITRFCYKYTYLYNFGNMNETTCKRDNNNIIEYETARFRIYNELNKYKFHKDLFNKTWLNYVIIVSILLITIFICIAFGYLFHHFFIQYNNSCSFNKEDLKNPNKKEYISILNLLIYCIQGENASFLPNCSFNYLILFIIIIIYPILYLLKFLLKIDYTRVNPSYYVKMFHLGVFIAIIYYEYILFINKGEGNEDYLKMAIYLIFIIIFYIADNIYNKAFDEYTSLTKSPNLYNDSDSSDITFFDIYKQQEPFKPIEPIKDDIIPPNFKTCTDEDFDNNKDEFCKVYLDSQISEATKTKELRKRIYNKILEANSNYYKKLEEYKKKINIYNTKYNIYKNNLIEFPKALYIVNYILPNMLGIKKKDVQILLIILIIIGIIIYLLKIYGNTKYSDYLYYTIFIYIIAILTLIILSNAILTYNTYMNKYLIYEPIAFYKEDFNNTNAIFNALLLKDVNTIKADNFIKYYNSLNNKKLLTFNQAQGNASQNSDDIIKNILNDIIKPLDSNYIPTINNNPNINILIISLNKIIFSNIIRLNVEDSTESLIIEHIKFLNDNKSTNFYTNELKILNDEIKQINSQDLSANLRTFLIIVKTLFLEDKSLIDIKINEMEKKLEYLIYNYTDSNPKYIFNNKKTFYNNFLNIDNINYNVDISTSNEIINTYKMNRLVIRKILDIFKKLVLTFRSNIVKLLSITDIYCNETEKININVKMEQFMKKIFTNARNTFDKNTYFLPYRFKTARDDKKIDIYERVLKNSLVKINNDITKHLNAIKYLMKKELTINLNEQTSAESIIINNYNFFNNDNKKHIENKLLEKSINIYNEYKNKYNLYKSNDLEELNISVNNVSWSFTILIIIFAIVLLEPTIV